MAYFGANCPDPTDCVCNLCYETQPEWALYLYIYGMLALNTLLLLGAAYVVYLLWLQRDSIASRRNLRVLVIVGFSCLVRVLDQITFIFTFDLNAMFDYLGSGLACMAVLTATVNLKQALNAASAQPPTKKLRTFLLGANSFIGLLMLLAVIGDRTNSIVFIVATGFLAAVVLLLLLISTIWIYQLSKLLRLHALHTDPESSRSLTGTVTRILITLVVFFLAGLLSIAAIFFHMLNNQQPWQWMIFWWVPRISCFFCMLRLVIFYKPDHRPVEQPKITRLSCAPSPASRTSSASPSHFIRSPSFNTIDPSSEPVTPSTPSPPTKPGLTRSQSGRPSIELGYLTTKSSTSKLSVLSMMAKEQPSDDDSSGKCRERVEV